MNKVNDRPLHATEEQNLFNVPFCSLLICRAIVEYNEHAISGMPFVLAFLVLPTVLHAETRELLPSTSATSFHSWLTGKPHIRIGLARRVRTLVPHSQRAIVYGLQKGALRLTDDTLLDPLVPPEMSSYRLQRGSEDFRSCYKGAGMIGRILGKAGSPSSILFMLGLRP